MLTSTSKIKEFSPLRMKFVLCFDYDLLTDTKFHRDRDKFAKVNDRTSIWQKRKTCIESSTQRQKYTGNKMKQVTSTLCSQHFEPLCVDGMPKCYSLLYCWIIWLGTISFFLARSHFIVTHTYSRITPICALDCRIGVSPGKKASHYSVAPIDIIHFYLHLILFTSIFVYWFCCDYLQCRQSATCERKCDDSRKKAVVAIILMEL